MVFPISVDLTLFIKNTADISIPPCCLAAHVSVKASKAVLLLCFMESCGGQRTGGGAGLDVVTRFATIQLFAVSYGCTEVFNLSIVSGHCHITLLSALFYICRFSC